ncbi:hypothetical protein [Polymorphobacter fuscus]|uniref:Uncharacterized protein n=1 Tax=Sandarakinorhabdus fusca TaxID=1439888 RepID=A0A7C9KVX6_9SPHN|nr:hypothetical protein [Polymorphobacter fuscus]KAB7648953.1 hypothetical protein F9290_04635 [Polymorphobacter fuscus]MQT16545.1 hypothetical protein [Polymorphobacter fuscus]NJC07164.1 hypothetical protein [Polymorphobacter fuscus]
MPSTSGIFDTRREAEMAIERLVQEHGVDRAVIAVAPAGRQNSVGIEVAGSDAKRGDAEPARDDEAALNGRIAVTVPDGVDAPVDDVFREFHATDIRAEAGQPSTETRQS